MSRIGKLPLELPKGVEVKLGADVVEVKGPKGTLSTPRCSLLDYKLEDGHVTLTRLEETREARAQHGLRRTLLANCVEGVSKGFSKTLEVNGVGFKVAVKGSIIELSVGFSHPVLVDLPKGLEAKAEGQKLTISGIDKEQVGEMCARIRRIRKPEPYKGKGIKYETEIIRRKAGKSGAKGK
ncbi:MAG TPA: 50S ribosomal protein L6 [Candidatus Mailhella excrementigallinarum]|nr:MAG: 50S ribosomal protein L6 [Desulfovibrionaceae bacterium]HIV66035.1 50S ribosomal protein L6 [Candidatus Mailhella excrementigallinarum]